MGRKVTDGLSVDFTAPAATHIQEGELYRVDNITHFAVIEVLDTETDDRNYAGDVSEALYRCLVPAGTCGTRGGFAGWSAGAGFKSGATDLVDVAEVAGDNSAVPAGAVVQVESVRNARGYATLRLTQ